MRMTGIIHWLSCPIVAPPTLVHPFLVIITYFLIQFKKKRMASFSKAYWDNLTTLHRWHISSSPNFSTVFDEYRWPTLKIKKTGGSRLILATYQTGFSLAHWSNCYQLKPLTYDLIIGNTLSRSHAANQKKRWINAPVDNFFILL